MYVPDFERTTGIPTFSFFEIYQKDVTEVLVAFFKVGKTGKASHIFFFFFAIFAKHFYL